MTKRQQNEAPVWITDPGHAWLRVPLADYTAAGITASKFSYVDAEYVYLEEDCDAALYLDIYRDRSPEQRGRNCQSLYCGTFCQPFREVHFDSVHAKGNPRNMDRIGGNVARDVTAELQAERAAMLQAAQASGPLVIIRG